MKFLRNLFGQSKPAEDDYADDRARRERTAAIADRISQAADSLAHELRTEPFNEADANVAWQRLRDAIMPFVVADLVADLAAEEV